MDCLSGALHGGALAGSRVGRRMLRERLAAPGE
jgi:hypothetical protein